MKNKTKTYILLVAVLTIWGIVGFRMVSTLNPDTPKVVQQDETVLFTPKTEADVERFDVQPSERDPFLGTMYTQKKTKAKPKVLHKKEPLVWPAILYHGDVSKQGSNAKICVISINGQQHIIKVNQKMDGVKLLKANSTEILVSYKGATKSIVKL